MEIKKTLSMRLADSIERLTIHQNPRDISKPINILFALCIYVFRGS